jgi:hypothetical protein
LDDCQSESVTSLSALSETGKAAILSRLKIHKMILELACSHQVVRLLSEPPAFVQTSAGGTSTPRQLAQWPALADMGIAQTAFTMNGCAIRPPHAHLKATGLLYVISGPRSSIQLAFTAPLLTFLALPENHSSTILAAHRGISWISNGKVFLWIWDVLDIPLCSIPKQAFVASLGKLQLPSATRHAN